MILEVEVKGFRRKFAQLVPLDFCNAGEESAFSSFPPEQIADDPRVRDVRNVLADPFWFGIGAGVAQLFESDVLGDEVVQYVHRCGNELFLIEPH